MVCIAWEPFCRGVDRSYLDRHHPEAEFQPDQQPGQFRKNSQRRLGYTADVVFFHRSVVISLILGVCAPFARSQFHTPINELGRAADIVAFSTVDSIVQQGGLTNSEASLRLRITQVFKGQSASSVVVATIASKCNEMGGGRLPRCVILTPDIIGRTGIWFLKAAGSGYRILPRKAGPGPDELFLPVVRDPGLESGTLSEILLAYHVHWFQSLANPDYRSVDENFFLSFEHRNSESPTSQQVLTAIAPLINSSYPGRHAAGLVIALRADSADAMTEVVNELSALRSNPRFPEIVFAIGAYPIEGKKDVRWIGPLRQLLNLHSGIPGIDAAAAGALYRIGTKQTLPMLAELLDSRDPTAQMIAVRTLGIYVERMDENGNKRANGPAGPLANDETRSHTPGWNGRPLTTPEYVAFWKSWWSGNRARLGFPAVFESVRPVPLVARDQPRPAPYINNDGIVRADSNKAGIVEPGIIISIYGRDFGAVNGCSGPALDLCGVQVLLDGKPIEIQHVNDVQINARIPDGVPSQRTSRLTVVSGGHTSDPSEVRRLP
jgi:hypothetical protein